MTRKMKNGTLSGNCEACRILLLIARHRKKVIFSALADRDNITQRKAGEDVREDIRRALRPFVLRLFQETVIHAALAGGAAAVLGLGSTHLLRRIGEAAIAAGKTWAGALPAFLLSQKNMPGALPGEGLVALGIGAAVFLLVCVMRRPTYARAAERADSLGLMDRAATMVAFAGNASFLAGMQREDAIKALSERSAREIPLSHGGRRWGFLGGALLFLALSFLLPDSLFTRFLPEKASAEASEEERLAREILDNLRAQIEEADLAEEERLALLKALEAAESGMGEGDMGMWELAEVMAVSGTLEEELSAVTVTQRWVETLLLYDRLRPVAQAYIDKDAIGLQTALAKEYQTVTGVSGTEQIITLMDLKTVITNALTEHEPEDRDAYLAYVFDTFANDCMGAAEYVASHEDPSRVIYSAFSRLERRLLTEMNGVEILVLADEDEDTIFLKKEGEGESYEEDTGRSGQLTDEEQDGEMLMLYTSNPDAMQGAGTGTRAQQHFQETEVIYEPSLDPYSASYDPVRAFRFQERGIESTDSHVSYGQVYGIYYARLLDAILEGNIPEELREAIEKYFYGL